MNTKTLMIALAAFAVGGVAHAITSDEIASALDTNVGTFSCAGVSDWKVDSSTFRSGMGSMRSGSVNAPDSTWQSSILTATLEVREPMRFSFWIKTSCYGNTSYAKFTVTVDGTVFTYYGETAWTKISSVLVPGLHSVKWEYSKRYNNNSGSDCAWVDDFAFEPIMEKPTRVEVTDIKCKQRYPWNGMVDIDYTVKCEKQDAEVWVYPVGYDKDTNMTMAPRALSGDGVDAPVSNGTFRMTWKVTDDYPNFHSTAFTVKMAALVGAAPYMVVDLSGGVDALRYPVSYLSHVPAGGWGNEYKTTKMVFRMIPSGSFMMGSPTDEEGRGSSYGGEDYHGVVLTNPYYIGVFEVTQRQYALVMGSNPSSYAGDTRAANNMTYTTIRGSVNGVGWPTHNQVDANSFMGRLRSKANMLFDLPTEAQWEFACRAGSSTPFNNGKGSAGIGAVARYYNNYCDYSRNGQYWDGKGGVTEIAPVGCYLPNAWGLYDMHGNVAEMCVDQLCYYTFAGQIDPKNGAGGLHNSSYPDRRVLRGGGFSYGWDGCRSAYRRYISQNSSSSDAGFRVYCSPVAQ